MKLLDDSFKQFRVPIPPVLLAHPANKGVEDDLYNGAFTTLLKETRLVIIAASGGGWDHVSVSTQTRCPTWEEMEFVKRMFFKDDEVAMQLHVPPLYHISIHPYALHLWRPHNTDIPLPPRIMV
jgi:hypothetical protein